jgi:hypothetical protein
MIPILQVKKLRSRFNSQVATEPGFRPSHLNYDYAMIYPYSSLSQVLKLCLVYQVPFYYNIGRGLANIFL